jgi:hypothetical protein
MQSLLPMAPDIDVSQASIVKIESVRAGSIQTLHSKANPF